jgi:conjugal transfer mating pair stabilization protein TraN
MKHCFNFKSLAGLACMVFSLWHTPLLAQSVPATTTTVPSVSSGTSTTTSTPAAPVCRKSGEVCVQGPETRNINGAQVTKACWKYQDTYECVENAAAIDNCVPLRTAPGCLQTSSVCADRAFNGTCLAYTNHFSCNTAQTVPSTIIQLTTSYNLGNPTQDASACTTYTQNPQCHKTGQTCTQPAETRIINGLPVTQSCWQWEDTYACVAITSSCDALNGDANCRKVGRTCTSPNPDGSCALSDVTYQCQTGVSPSHEVTTCGSTFCINGSCIQLQNTPNDDFAETITGLEVGREAAGYASGGTTNPKFFKGDFRDCAINPLNSCCKTSNNGSGMSNNSMVSGAMGAAAKGFGSWYTYDALGLQSTGSLNAIYSAFFTSNTVSQFQFSGISYYGITFNPFSATQIFAFDPTSFAISVAIAVIQELLKCTQDEQVLGMARGQNLCHYVGSFCGAEFLGACMQTKETYCCFNSRLAVLIQEGARPQLGKSWGTAESAECSGFSPEDFKRIDFSQIDLSAFAAEIQAHVAMPNVSDTTGTNKDKINRRIEDYFNNTRR